MRAGMTVSRRETLKAAGLVGGLGAISGRVYARGEHEDDERTPAAGGSQDESAPVAGVRVAHFSPDAPNVDVYVDDEQVLSDVAFETVSDYLEVEPGIHQLTLTAAGDPETVVYDDETSFGQAFYTVAALGEVEGETFQLRILPDATSALVRFLHGTPDAPPLSVSKACGDRRYFDNVAFEEQTHYVVFAAGPCRLDVYRADATGEGNGGDGEPLASLDVELEQGTAYSVFAVGYLEEDPPFALHLVEDGTISAGSGESGE